MIPLDEVRDSILRSVVPLPAVAVPRDEALGLALADDVVADESVPPFANTAMDGYALRATDVAGANEAGPVRLRVVGDLPAGRAPTVAVGPGETIRIMTGAPMPEGADAVVMVERTVRDGDDGVLVQQAAHPGDHVRPAGSDLADGQLVFPAGTVLGPAALGVLASLDRREVIVHRRARVGVLSTGDELVASGPLAPGKIRDSNRPMLRALAARTGATAIDLGSVGDDENLMIARLREAAGACDVVLTSGGVSVGDYDYVSAALERVAAEDTSSSSRVDWYQVAIKPAKPLCVATLDETPVFGLPGNPVSSLVGFELFARPAILGRMGYPDVRRLELTATAAHAMTRRRDGKLHLDRVRAHVEDGALVATSVGHQHSNALGVTAVANALALIPDGEGIEPGGDVTVMLLDLL